MKTYHAKVERTLVVEFDFTDEEMEEGDSPEYAASELADSQPQVFWDMEFEEVTISESIYDDSNA